MSQLSSAHLWHVTGELAALAQWGTSGILTVRGDPGGVIYLSNGYLVFAESSGAPDLGSRLVNSRRLLVEQWAQAHRDSEPGACAGDSLLSRGLLDLPEWHAVLSSATLDVLVVLAMQLASDPRGPETSFTPQRVPFAETVLTMHTGPAWAHAAQEAERLARHDVAPGARPQLREQEVTWPLFGPEAITVLGQINGYATVRDLAWRNGLALYGVMNWLVRLIQNGVCTMARTDTSDRPGRYGPPPAGTGIDWALPEPDLLGQVLAGLKRLHLRTVIFTGQRRRWVRSV